MHFVGIVIDPPAAGCPMDVLVVAVEALAAHQFPTLAGCLEDPQAPRPGAQHDAWLLTPEADGAEGGATPAQLLRLRAGHRLAEHPQVPELQARLIRGRHRLHGIEVCNDGGRPKGTAGVIARDSVGPVAA
eukprot:CAMPEP_0203891850 /NCGR_PEP_ID=MMETSP0359-20131031/35095_1 /ASSEMBLY_ACC=CAM_ASM_000338 /TAXON_ID=268821 /ORGANISM="Scrippsiella Hangoei, Strain SHTV-5" /LENGTH=130 /DNA_ID=CAMNT_0050813697 /DNA_START=520 /DNA_END=908 /DNA_ORIENTATION=-